MATSTRVYSYGCDEPKTHATKVRDDIRRVNRYRNAIVELELARRAKVNDARRKYFPRIVDMEGSESVLLAQLEAAREKVSADHSASRKRDGSPNAVAAKGIREKLKLLREELKIERIKAFGPPDLQAAKKAYGVARAEAKLRLKKNNPEIVDADAEVVAAREAMNALVLRWYQDVPSARKFSAILSDADRLANEGLKRLRKLFSDIPWGTRGAIEQAAKDFRQGTPPKFKSFRGDGKEVVQTMESPSVREVLGATLGQLSVADYDPNGGKQLSTVKLRVGTDPETKAPVWADIPTVFHRPLPEDAQIKYAAFVTERVGTTHSNRMQFTLSRETDRWTKPRLADRGRVAMDLGWRVKDDGSLRVCYWVGDDGREGELIFPAKLLARMVYIDKLRSDRDREFNRVRDWLVGQVKASKVIPDWLMDRLCAKTEDKKRGQFTLHQWRAPAKLAAVIIHWRENRFDGDAAMFERLENWRAWDERNLNDEAWTRKRALEWRDEMLKVFVARKREEYRTAIIEDVDWAAMKRKRPVEEEDKKRVVGWHMVAAPGTLEEILKREMVETVTVPAEQTMKCSACGKLTLERSKAKIVHQCRKCRATFDQDRNAAVNALVAAV